MSWMTQLKMSEPHAISGGSVLPYPTDCTESESEPDKVQRNSEPASQDTADYLRLTFWEATMPAEQAENDSAASILAARIFARRSIRIRINSKGHPKNAPPHAIIRSGLTAGLFNAIY
jgi:hypothetical protein